MGNAAIRGVIRGERGQPLAGATVLATIEGEACEAPALAEADASGAYELELRWPGDAEIIPTLAVRAAAHAGTTWPLDADLIDGRFPRISDGSTLRVDVAMSRGFSLDLRLFDEDDRPVEGAEVELIENHFIAGACGLPLSMRLPGVEVGLTSDASGRVLIEGLPEPPYGVRYYIAARHPERAEAVLDRPELLPRQGHTATARLLLPRGHQVEGVVRGERGAQAAVLSFLQDPDIPPCYAVVRKTEAGAGGRFCLGGLVAGTHLLRAEAPGAMVAERTITVPHEGPLSLDLPPARQVRGVVLGDDGAPLAGAIVEALRADGAWSVSTETDEAGRFVFESVPTDTEVWIAVSHHEPMGGLGLARLDAGRAPAELGFDARKTARWSGVLRDDRTGARVALPASICARPLGLSTFFRGGGPEPDGAFTLRLPAGRFDVAFVGNSEMDWRCGAVWRAVEVQEGEMREGVEVGVCAVFRTSLRVKDAETGQPIAGAAVSGKCEFFLPRIFLGNTGPDGVYWLESALEVPIRFRVSAPGYELRQLDDWRPQRGAPGLLVELRRASA